MPSDESLVARVRQRDPVALEVLYARHCRSVYSLVLRLVVDVHAAEDIVQDCFVKLWRQPDRYVPEKGRLGPWLLGVAHHRAVDWLRRRNLERRHNADGVDPLDHAASGGDPASLVVGAVRQEAVARALAQLPDAQRITVELAYMRGMTQTQIADYLGEPLGTVKTRTRLAMKKLRSSIDPTLVEDVP